MAEQTITIRNRTYRVEFTGLDAIVAILTGPRGGTAVVGRSATDGHLFIVPRTGRKAWTEAEEREALAALGIPA